MRKISNFVLVLLFASSSVFANVNEELNKMIKANMKLDVDSLYEMWLKEYDTARPSKIIDNNGEN